MIKDVPEFYTVKPCHLFNTYKNSPYKLKRMKSRMETKKYNPRKLGKELLGKAISITPKASQNILQSTIPLIYSAFSADIGLDVSHQDICDMAPGRHAVKNLVAEQASLSYLRVIEILKKIRTYTC